MKRRSTHSNDAICWKSTVEHAIRRCIDEFDDTDKENEPVDENGRTIPRQPFAHDVYDISAADESVRLKLQPYFMGSVDRCSKLKSLYRHYPFPDARRAIPENSAALGKLGESIVLSTGLRSDTTGSTLEHSGKIMYSISSPRDEANLLAATPDALMIAAKQAGSSSTTDTTVTSSPPTTTTTMTQLVRNKPVIGVVEVKTSAYVDECHCPVRDFIMKYMSVSKIKEYIHFGQPRPLAGVMIDIQAAIRETVRYAIYDNHIEHYNGQANAAYVYPHVAQMTVKQILHHAAGAVGLNQTDSTACVIVHISTDDNGNERHRLEITFMIGNDLLNRLIDDHCDSIRQANVQQAS